MEHCKLDFKRLLPFLIVALLLASCNKIINFFDILGIIPPKELKLDLQLERQIIGEPFSFVDYCEEKFDSIFLVYPYFNIEREDFVNLKMSNRLRNLCNSNTNFDSFSTLLFINDRRVKAFSKIDTEKIRLTPPAIPENIYKFSFNQKFILDEMRYAHIYNE